MNKILNNASSNDNNHINNQFNNLNENHLNLDEYPLNLISNINLLLSAGIIFYMVIFNMHAVQYIIKKDYIRYIPDNGL